MTSSDAEVVSVPEKTCNKCKVTRPLTMFAVRKGHRDGREGTCRVCHRIMTRIHRLKLDPAVAATPMPEDGRCEVCGVQPPNWGLCLDHDHDTGAFRGWLCNQCNGAMGFAGDDPERLRALADYLDRKRASSR